MPPAGLSGYVTHSGAEIWYAAYGAGPTVFLLHGGLGNSGDWGYQVGAITSSGYRVVTIDTRGHGRSTRDARPFSYELLASDVLAVMDSLKVARAALIGWSDGACTSLVLARQFAERVAGVFYFACNMDPSGVKRFENTPVIERCFTRHKEDYMELSATPDRFDRLVQDLTRMQTNEPNFSKADLTSLRVPVTIAQSGSDEFIKIKHARYLAKSIPMSQFVQLQNVSHFAPLQRPEEFNEQILFFLHRISF